MQTDIELTPDQKNVLASILNWLKNREGRHLSIGGYAGTGKTTLIAYARKHMAQHTREIKKVAFCSFTGKAAAVLRQKLKESSALFPEDSCGTIHSLIYKAVTDDAGQILAWDKVSTLAVDLIVIDEGSMVNERIWNDLLGYDVPIVVFGDHGQLPPVEGSFNLMESPHLKLETIVRQAEDSPIIRLSRRVREGGDIPYGNFGRVSKFGLHNEEASELFENMLEQNRNDTLCICGTNRTRTYLNKRIRALRGFENEEPQKGDRVICLKNNYAKMIFNGMLGTIKRIDADSDHWYDVRIAIDDGLGDYKGTILRHQFHAPKTLRGETARQLNIEVPEREFGDLFDFGYALTTHKAQGSEAERVVLFEERMYGYTDDMWRRWLYTAVTRAREELIIFA